MAINLLSSRRINTAPIQAKPYWLRDGGSLFLHIQPNGSKLWRYRYRLDGRAQVYAIGRYPAITLTAARTERDRARSLVQRGIHPLADKRSKLASQLDANRHTFAVVAQRWMEFNVQWSDSYARQIDTYLARDVYPSIGRVPIATICAPHVRAIVETIAGRGAKCAAILVRQWISQVFSYAVLNGLCESNPALHLKGFIRRAEVRHHPPLSRCDIPEFFGRLRQWHGHASIVIGLQLMALTFVRTAELRRAEWSEFDLDNQLWSIPKAHMKMRRPHLVPLSRQAVALLRALHVMTGHGSMLFPNRRQTTGVIAPTTFNRVIGRLGYGGRFSAHGFRATATTILGLLGYPDKQVDLQLAHTKKDTSRVPYDHSKFLGSRALVMQDWADILDALIGGTSLQHITQAFGPLSERRTALLRVTERE